MLNVERHYSKYFARYFASSRKQFVIIVGGASIVFILDLLSKFWATERELVVLNEGISFSLFSGVDSLILTIFMSISLIMAGFLLFKAKAPAGALALFSGGSFGNIADRIIFGGVRDWLPIPGFDGLNNFADWCIFLSVIWIIASNTNKKLMQKGFF